MEDTGAPGLRPLFLVCSPPLLAPEPLAVLTLTLPSLSGFV